MSGTFHEFIAALGIFLLSHMVPAIPFVRRALVRSAGERVYLVAYSLVSILLLVWLVDAALRAPRVSLWPYWTWSPWIPALAMPAACILLVAGLAGPNPLSITASRRPFDPSAPGIAAVTRHPVLWAFAIWALAHLPPNGDVAQVTMFATFALFALGGMYLADVKARRRLGREEWRRLARGTSVTPFAAVLAGRARLGWRGVGAVGWVAGLALYVALAALHPIVIGVSPLPRM